MLFKLKKVWQQPLKAVFWKRFFGFYNNEYEINKNGSNS